MIFAPCSPAGSRRSARSSKVAARRPGPRATRHTPLQVRLGRERLGTRRYTGSVARCDKPRGVVLLPRSLVCLVVVAVVSFLPSRGLAQTAAPPSVPVSESEVVHGDPNLANMALVF